MGFSPHNLGKYIREHAAVWPSMQRALVASGWHNYSLFCAPDGLAVGAFDSCATFDEACAAMDGGSAAAAVPERRA